jgi:imidazolonepropionase
MEHEAETIIDCTGKTVMPGFVDPHTHLVFAGSRERELGMKLRGMTYMEILQSGGGILSTVKATRGAGKERLFEQSRKRLDMMMSFGTTTAEAKSGYGLDKETELKMLEVINNLDASHPMDIVPTFLGAHAIPEEYADRSEDYIKSMIGLLPEIREKGLAEFCDVFCEEGAFSLEESKYLLMAAKDLGFGAKMHADEIKNLGGSSLAAEIGAISAEHLAVTSDDDMKAMAEVGVIGLLLPGTPYSLMEDQYADARKMIEIGMPIALATDLNPNCWTESMQFIISLACYKMRMTPEEAIVASTINAAFAVNRAEQVGSIEVGKQADLIILDVPNYAHIPYHFGVNLVEKVIKSGKVVVG